MKNKAKLITSLLSLGLILTACGNNKDKRDLSSDSKLSYSDTSNNKKSEVSKKDQGKIEESSINSDILKQNWKYKVYLPSGYDENRDEKYPVLYMLHGMGGNSESILEKSNTKEKLDKIMKDKKTTMIVVFVDGFSSFYVDSDYDKKIESAIKDELIKEIDKNYNTNSNKNARAIGGVSMGGYGAASLSLKNPDLFSTSLLISPTLWENLDKESPIRRNYRAFSDGKEIWSDEVYNKKFPSNYIDEKSKDINFYIRSSQGDQTINIEDIEKFNKSLEKAGIKTEFKEDGKEFDHNWDYWNKITEESYQWVLDQFDK